MGDVGPIEARYASRTQRSLETWRSGCQVLADGNTRALATFPPHPIVLLEGAGARVTDADGNVYYDLLNNYTSLVHGNAHPALIEAATSVMASGTVFPAPHPAQARHAAMVCDRLAGAEMARYANSGTEASMLAVRAARAATGRQVVVKARGGYHGSWEGLVPDAGLESGGDRAHEPGIPAGVSDRLGVIEYNDAADLERVCRLAGSDLAAIILEPMLGSGGAIPATAAFLSAARRLADELGAVLILDEVQTFRLAPGGLQSVLGCQPDLTVLGKLIGGGFPIGAVAGRRDVLEVFSTRSARHVEHSGTFNGNLVSMAAGARAMELLTPEAIGRINEVGDTLRRAVSEAIASSGLRGTVTGYGSMLNVHLGPHLGEITTHSDVLAEDDRTMELLHLALMNEGIFSAPRGFLNTSTALGDDDVANVERALKQAVADVAAEAPAGG